MSVASVSSLFKLQEPNKTHAEEPFFPRRDFQHLSLFPLRLSFQFWLVLFIVTVVLFMQECCHPGLILMANNTSASEDESTLYFPRSVHQKAISYLTPEHCPSKQDS